MFCQNCGKQIADDPIFCGYCGNATPNVDYSIVENHIIEENITDSKQAGNYYLSNVYPDDGIVANTNIAPLYSDAGKTVVPNIKKKSKKIKAIFYIIFSFLLVISGAFSGYYVAKNGWDYKKWSNNHISSDIISEGYSYISDEVDENNSSDEKEKPVNTSGISLPEESSESRDISDSLSYDNINSIMETSSIISN